MNNDKRKGIFSKWFGVKKSCCCDINFEEVKDEEESENINKQDDKSADSDDAKGKGRSCCG